MVDRIRQNVQQQSEPNIRYWQDLATMDESNDPELYNNLAKQVEIIKIRLERLAMVGVLERWEPSLKLLQRVVNPARLFRETSRRHANQSRISTGHVVQRIKNDVTLYEEILHLLRYEQEIYEHGLRLHLAQCARAGIG